MSFIAGIKLSTLRTLILIGILVSPTFATSISMLFSKNSKIGRTEATERQTNKYLRVGTQEEGNKDSVEVDHFPSFSKTKNKGHVSYLSTLQDDFDWKRKFFVNLRVQKEMRNGRPVIKIYQTNSTYLPKGQNMWVSSEILRKLKVINDNGWIKGPQHSLHPTL